MRKWTTRGCTIAALVVLGTGLQSGGIGAQEPGGPHLGLPPVLERGTTGPRLLLFPCAGCGARSWDRFMEANEDRFRMIAVTLPGQDGSPRPELPQWSDEPVFQDNALEQISRLVDERGLTDITVVGHSFGAHMAMRFATTRPDVVTGMINVDGSATNPVSWAELDRDALVAQTRRTVDEDWALRLQDPDTFRGFNGARTQPDEEQRKLHHGMFMASDRLTMLHYWRENLLADRNPEFRALSIPFLDIEAVSPRSPNPDSAAAAYAASMDEVGTPARYERIYAWDTSHWVHLEHPRTLGRIILNHIEGRPVHDIGPFRMGEVTRSGSGERDVLLLPCTGCDTRAWGAFMERNRSRYRMVAVAWPALGPGGVPGSNETGEGTPSFEYLMRALELLVEREELDRPVIAGHGAAGDVALRFASEHPDLAGGVVTVDGVLGEGAGLDRLPVPFLAIHGLPADGERRRRARAELEARYGPASLPPGGRVALLEHGGARPLMNEGSEAFDQVFADFVLGMIGR